QPHGPVGRVAGYREEPGEVLVGLPEQFQAVCGVRELVVGQSPGPLLEAVGRLDRALRARGVPALGGAHQLPEAVGESHARSFPVRISSPPRYAGPGPDGGPPRRSPLLAVRVELTA